MSIESVMPSNHLILCHPLLLLPSIFPSIRVFSNVSSSHQMAKVLEGQLQQPSFQWIFKVVFLWDWLVWFACSPRDSQESSPAHTLKASILWHSVVFMVQLSHPYMTTGQTIALTIWAFVGKVISLFFNTLSRLVIAFLPRSKHLLISWLQSLSVVILEPKYLLLVFVGVFGSFFFFFNGGIVPFWKFTSVIQCWPF